ncbi:MAG: hypothetical protein KBD90_04700 [Alphaproteobacteria bacterium]|jgi:hypothetical protein|nr:hypothetical protein [Alphaproteobacteria bacterium]
MRYIFLIFLSLSFPVLAQEPTNVSQEKPKPPSPKKDDGRETIPPCDPEQETHMPEFN